MRVRVCPRVYPVCQSLSVGLSHTLCQSLTLPLSLFSVHNETKEKTMRELRNLQKNGYRTKFLRKESDISSFQFSLRTQDGKMKTH